MSEHQKRRARQQLRALSVVDRRCVSLGCGPLDEHWRCPLHGWLGARLWWGLNGREDSRRVKRRDG